MRRLTEVAGLMGKRFFLAVGLGKLRASHDKSALTSGSRRRRSHRTCVQAVDVHLHRRSHGGAIWKMPSDLLQDYSGPLRDGASHPASVAQR